jgi:hypothetical protein
VSKKFRQDDLLKLVDIFDDELLSISRPVNNLRILRSLSKRSNYVKDVKGFSDKACNLDSFAVVLINI